MNMRKCLVLLALGVFGLVLPIFANANITLNRAIIYFQPNARPVQTIGVINIDETRTFAVKTRVIEVLNSGHDNRKDIATKTLVVAPNAFEVAAKKTRNIRLMLREKNTSDMEKVYRVTFIPEAPSRTVETKSATGVETRVDIIVGMGAFQREDGLAMHAALHDVAETLGAVKENWNGFNVLHNAASRMAALEIGFTSPDPFNVFDMGLVYLLGVDNPETLNQINPHSFVIYQGHHGDLGAHRADLILPGAAYTEKDGTYMNTEGRAQRGRRAVFPPGEAKEDWTILRALSERCDQTLPFDDMAELRADMIAQYPALGAVDEIIFTEWADFGDDARQVRDAPLVNSLNNFYITNVITRHSERMARCVERFLERDDEKEAA